MGETVKDGTVGDAVAGRCSANIAKSLEHIFETTPSLDSAIQVVFFFVSAVGEGSKSPCAVNDEFLDLKY